MLETMRAAIIALSCTAAALPATATEISGNLVLTASGERQCIANYKEECTDGDFWPEKVCSCVDIPCSVSMRLATSVL